MKRVASALVGLVGVAAAAGGCSGEEPASVMVAITSEAPVPEGIDTIEVSVRRGGVEKFVNFYQAGSSLKLPGTLAVDNAPGQDVDDPVSITVVASAKGVVQVERRATVLFVENEQRVLRMPLRFACVGVECAAGATCKAGACVPEATDLAREPVYEERLVFGDASGAACFRRRDCGDERTTLTAEELGSLFDPAACTLQVLAPGRTREDLNMGLIWKQDPRRAVTVVDLDPVEGWSFDEAYEQTGKVRLVPGLCEALKAGKVEGGQRVLGCAPKAPTQPFCPDDDGALR